jgi:hypothetical protein
MSPVAIILGIVIILLIYVLYKFFRNDTGAILTKTSNLNTTNETTVAIKRGSISSGQSPIYSYGLWLYVNTWSTNAKTIFRRQNKSISGKDDIKLYLDTTTPTLKCDFYTNYSTNTPLETVNITTNFPIQKWVHIIVSIDNKIVDTYLDGQLITSQQLNGTPTVSDGDIYLGKFDAYMANFQNWNSAMDPQTAWKTYMSGNGGNAISKMFKSYGIDFSLKKDNVEQYKLNVF